MVSVPPLRSAVHPSSGVVVLLSGSDVAFEELELLELFVGDGDAAPPSSSPPHAARTRETTTSSPDVIVNLDRMRPTFLRPFGIWSGGRSPRGPGTVSTEAGGGRSGRSDSATTTPGAP